MAVAASMVEMAAKMIPAPSQGTLSTASEMSSGSSTHGAWDEPCSCWRDTPIEDDFELSAKVLGSGLSGDVREGLCRRTGRAFAVKTFGLEKMSARHLTNLRHEVDVLSSLSHSKIMQLEAVYETKEQVHLVLEKLSGGEVFDRLQTDGRFDEASAASVAAQLLRAVAHLHARGIIHRDLKPENIMYEDKSRTGVKLIDFGFGTRFARGEVLNQMCGTIQYIAPEVLRRTGYTAKADIWSAGSVIYTLLTNKVMYGGGESDVKSKNKQGAIDFSRTFNTVSKEGQDFVRFLLRLDPEDRPSAMEALQHPWLLRHAPAEAEAALAEAAGDELGGVRNLRAEPRAQLRMLASEPSSLLLRAAPPQDSGRGFRLADKLHPRLLGAGHQAASKRE